VNNIKKKMTRRRNRKIIAYHNKRRAQKTSKGLPGEFDLDTEKLSAFLFEHLTKTKSTWMGVHNQ